MKHAKRTFLHLSYFLANKTEKKNLNETRKLFESSLGRIVSILSISCWNCVCLHNAILELVETTQTTDTHTKYNVSVQQFVQFSFRVLLAHSKQMVQCSTQKPIKWKKELETKRIKRNRWEKKRLEKKWQINFLNEKATK